MADVFFTVGAEVDQSQVEQEAQKAGAGFGKRFSKASQSAAGSADVIFKDIEAALKRVTALQGNFAKSGLNTAQFAPLQRGLERLLALQREFEADRERLSKDKSFLALLKAEGEAIKSLTSSQTRELQSTVAAANIAARAEAHAADRDSALRNIQAQRDAQLQVNAARTAGKARIVLAQQIGAQLLSIERILSNGITNIIRGTSKAISAVWQSTVGSLRRTFSERRTIVEGGLRNESRLFTQSTIISQRANQGLLGTISNNLGAIGGGFAIGAAARQIFTLGSEFTRGLNVLQAQLGLTDEQMKAVQKTAIELGNDIALPGVSALDAANAINLLTKQFGALGAGASQAALEASKGTLQLARAVAAPAEDAAQAVGVAVNVFTKDAKTATDVADGLAFALSKAAGTSFQDFTQAFTQAATVFSSFQSPVVGGTKALDEFNAAIALLAKGGLVGSDAGTSLRNFFTQATRGTDDANQALKEVADRAGITGSVFFDAAGNGRDFTQIIAALQNGLKGLSQEQKQSTLLTIFGTDAIRAANILVDQGAFAFQQLTDAVGKQGFAAKLAAAQNKGLAGAIDAIKSQFQTFAILIFQKVNPVLGDIGLAIAGFIDKIANGEGAFATFRKAALGVAAALGAIVALRGISEIAGLIGSIVSLLGPFGLAVAGIGAVIGIATGGFRNFGGTLERLQEILKTVTRLVGIGLSKAMAFLTAQFKKIQPVLQPVIDRLSAFGRRIVDIARSFQQAFQFGGLTNAFRNLRRNLASFGQDIGAVLAPVGRRLGELLVPVRDLALNVRDRLVAVFRSIDFGQIVSVIGNGIRAAVSTSLGRALTGGGIGAVAGGLIAGPLGAALGAGLGAAIGLAIPKIKAAIGRINVADLFGKFLEGVRKVGELIGKILSDKRTILAVAGIAAAAAALAAQFISGFVSGILGNLGSVADAGAAILNALFNQSSIVKAILALIIVLRSKLFSLFTSSKVGEEGGKAIAKNVADGAAKELPVTLASRIKTAGSSVLAAFADLGKKAASGLVVALSAGLSGSALGGATNALEGGLAAAGLAASAAQAFAIGSATPAGPAGGAALAGATVGIGLLSAALSANAKHAQEAKARMQEYRDAVRDAGKQGKDSSQAIEDVFSQNLLDASDKTIRGLQDVGLSMGELQKQAREGDLSGAITTLNDELKITQAESTAAFNKGLVPQGNAAIKKAADLQAALKFVNQQQKAISEEAKRSALEKSLTPGAGFTNLRSALQGIVDKVKEAVRERQKLIADLRAERLLASAKVIEDGMTAIGTAAEASRQKILDLAKPVEAKTPEVGGAEAVTGVAAVIPDVSQAFLDGLNTALGSAELTTAIASLSGPLGSAVQDGLGNAFTPEQIATNLALVKQAINQATTPDGTPISDGVKAALLDGVAKFEQQNVPLIINEQAVADLRSAALAGDQMAAATLASKGLSSPISIKSKADAVAAGLAGDNIFTTADTFVARQAIAVKSKADNPAATKAGSDIHSTAQKNADKQITVGSKVTATPGAGSEAGRSIATNVGTGFKNGLAGLFTSIQKTVTTIVNGAVINTAQATLRISSPSKVFMGIGEDTIRGLAIGLTNTTDEAVSAAQAVAEAVIEATRSTATRLAAAGRAATGGIFEGVFNSAAQQAQRAGFDAGIQVTRALEAIRDSVDQEAIALWNAAAKPPGERSGAEARIVAASNFASAFNLNNQQAIANAVDAVKEVGRALIDQGFGAQAAADAMLNYRNALIAAAAAAGLNANEVAGIVDSLGLSNSALQEFIRLAQQAQGIVNAAPGFTPSTTPLTPGPNAAQTFIINNEFATPFDDPQAVSLAVVNRLAQSVRR